MIAARILPVSILLLLLVPRGAAGREEWTRTDTAFHLVLVGVTITDCLQTHSFLSERKFHEINPVLGSRPSHSAVNAWCGASLVGQLGIALVLPQPYRRAWQGLLIGIELHAVYWNGVQGIGLSFRW